MKMNLLKKIQLLIIILLQIPLISKSQYLVPDRIRNYDADEPAVYSEDVKGSIMQVTSLSERDAIPEAKRELGMLVTHLSSSVYYTYRYEGANILDANWTNVSNWVIIADERTILDTVNYSYKTDTCNIALSTIRGDTLFITYSDTITFTGDSLKADSVKAFFEELKSNNYKLNNYNVINDSVIYLEYDNGNYLRLYLKDDFELDVYMSDGTNDVQFSLWPGNFDVYSYDGSKTYGVQTSSEYNYSYINADEMYLFVYEDSINIENGSYTTLNVTDTLFKADSLNAIFKSLKIGESDIIDTIQPLKDAVEQTIFDSIVIGRYFIRFNENYGLFEFGTSVDSVIWQGAIEDLAQVYNNTTDTLKNGTPVSYTGTIGDSIGTVDYYRCSVRQISDRAAGVITASIPPNNWGYICTRGFVHHIDFSTFVNPSKIIYGGDSVLIDTIVGEPNYSVAFGVIISPTSDGTMYVNIDHFTERKSDTKTYNLPTGNLGTYYEAGYYRASSTSVTLTQASPTVTYGTAGVAYSAHGFVVCGGVGTVDAGIVGLSISGTSIDDYGTLTTSDEDTIITDITTTALNDYFEGKKFVGTMTFGLITIDGSPTTYSLTINYGYAKYEDFNNRDFYLIGSECVGRAGANDSGFGIELLHHSDQGWTYSASSFIPGGNVIISSFTDLAGYDDMANGIPWVYKRSDINYRVLGSENEGLVYRVTVTTNNAVQDMDLHLNVSLDR